MEDILNIQDKYGVDESIKEYDYVEHLPSSGCDLNMAGQISIPIENADVFLHPHHSWLLFEGELKKADDTRYPDNALATLTNNAMMYLFTNIRYNLGGQEIESLNHPGFATTMMGLVKQSLDFAKGSGMMSCWRPDTTTAAADDNKGFAARRNFIINSSDPKGSFSFGVPLQAIFGFCEDFTKITYGMRHRLVLVRGDDSNAIFRHNGVAAGKVTLSKISWMMPRVYPNDEAKYALYKTIENNKAVLDVAFRMHQCNITELPANTTTHSWRLGVKTAPEKPRYVIVGIQRAKADNQVANASIFDHSSVVNMSVVLNSTKYPTLDVNANFASNKFAPFYKYMTEFKRDYYGLDPIFDCSAISPHQYKDLFPIFVFNVSRQSERLASGVVDMTVEMKFGENIQANTKAYAIVISDRRLKLESDGKKMNVIY